MSRANELEGERRQRAEQFVWRNRVPKTNCGGSFNAAAKKSAELSERQFVATNVVNDSVAWSNNPRQGGEQYKIYLN